MRSNIFYCLPKKYIQLYKFKAYSPWRLTYIILFSHDAALIRIKDLKLIRFWNKAMRFQFGRQEDMFSFMLFQLPNCLRHEILMFGWKDDKRGLAGTPKKYLPYWHDYSKIIVGIWSIYIITALLLIKLMTNVKLIKKNK